MADFGKEKRRRKCKGELFVAVIPPSLTSSWGICNKFDFSNHQEISSASLRALGDVRFALILKNFLRKTSLSHKLPAQ